MKLPALAGIPVAPLMGYQGAGLTGTSIKDNLENADVQFRSLMALYEKFKPDAVFTIMDLTLEAEALGLKVLKPDNSAYSVAEHPIKTKEDLEKLRLPDPSISGRMPVLVNVMEKMSAGLDCCKIGYVIGPFTLSGLLMGAEDAAKSIIKRPDFLKSVLEFSTQLIEEYAKAFIKAGADAICILEPTAIMLSPKRFHEFTGEYLRRIMQVLQAPSILHICGDTSQLVDQMLSTGAQGISLDSMVNFNEIKDLVPDDVLLIGNIDPVRVVAFGDEQEVKDAAEALLRDMKGCQNFVLSSGCYLPQDTKMDNISTMINMARNAG